MNGCNGAQVRIKSTHVFFLTKRHIFHANKT